MPATLDRPGAGPDSGPHPPPPPQAAHGSRGRLPMGRRRLLLGGIAAIAALAVVVLSVWSLGGIDARGGDSTSDGPEATGGGALVTGAGAWVTMTGRERHWFIRWSARNDGDEPATPVRGLLTVEGPAGRFEQVVPIIGAVPARGIREGRFDLDHVTPGHCATTSQDAVLCAAVDADFDGYDVALSFDDPTGTTRPWVTIVAGLGGVVLLGLACLTLLGRRQAGRPRPSPPAAAGTRPQAHQQPPRTCGSCGAGNEATAAFCTGCGRPLTTASDPLTSRPR